jgi:DNA-binding CsgD family transcriptional regulator/tetratricopeptide (TPR) repeat protein
MTAAQALERGRESFDRRSWAESYRLLRAVERETPLEPADLERLATAAYLLGRDEESEVCRTRAHQAYLERADRERAALSAWLLGFGLLHRGARAPASGWFARAERILEEAQLDCAVSGYLLIPAAIQRVMQGDAAGGDAAFTRAADIARRFGDRDLASIACGGRGRALIRLGQVVQGVALLDEAMVAVIAGDVTPIPAGDVYCTVLEGCQEIFDIRRSYEWTASLARWCSAQSDLVRYRGECLLYRAEVMQFRGQWTDAARDAHDACELLLPRQAAGAAFYRVGELHRLRGEIAEAESAYARANECGRKPQPGLSLLRLEQGQLDVAAASIRAVLADTPLRAARTRLLPAAVEILLASGHVDEARAAATELSDIARVLKTPFLSASAAHATGAVLVADGDITAASSALRQACAIWRDLGTPYEEAQSCRLMAAVCERRGDLEGQRLELDGARKLLEALTVESSLSPIEVPDTRAPQRAPASLSDRELQVLRLLAAGRTNRAIAEELFISEKTVARHVSNIFDKLGVSSRTGAAAWAFQHNLV